MKNNLLFLFALFLLSHARASEKQYMVLFDYNKYEIHDTALLDLMKIISKNVVAKIIIEGHCDSIGSQHYNYKLSEKRADEVKKFLIQNGISAKAIKTCIGFGEDEPLTNNQSEKDRQQNRRVLIHFEIKEVIPTFTVGTQQPIKPTLESKNFVAGNKIVLERLLFEGGRHVLKPESTPVLQDLCSILTKNENLKIAIQGHVCCTTIEQDGHDFDTGKDNLSVARAKMVYEYLIQICGIERSRLSYEGFGGTQKIYKDDIGEAEQRINRRVEIKVTEN